MQRSLPCPRRAGVGLSNGETQWDLTDRPRVGTDSPPGTMHLSTHSAGGKNQWDFRSCKGSPNHLPRGLWHGQPACTVTSHLLWPVY